MKLAPVLAPLALAGCVTAPTSVDSVDGIARAGFNERTYVDGPFVTPLAVVEDSRCPIGAQCATPGRTRVMVRIDLGSRSEFHELSSDKPLQVADGQLALVEVQPQLAAGQPGRDAPYRFGFRFAGGI